MASENGTLAIKVNPTDRGFDEYYGFIKGHSAPQWDPSYYHRYPETRTPELSFDRRCILRNRSIQRLRRRIYRPSATKRQPLVSSTSPTRHRIFPYMPRQKPAIHISIFTVAVGMSCAVNATRASKNPVMATENWQFTPRSLVPLEENDAIRKWVQWQTESRVGRSPPRPQGGPHLPHGGLCRHDRAHRSRHWQNH